MKEIIIDDVNVAGCIYFQQEDDEYTCGAEECNGAVVGCRACDNCYYKQLKRLEQEKAELKEENKRLEKLKCKFKEYCCTCNTEKYVQCLQEIKTIAEDGTKTEDYLLGQRYTDLIDRILDLITKAEVGE